MRRLVACLLLALGLAACAAGDPPAAPTPTSGSLSIPTAVPEPPAELTATLEPTAEPTLIPATPSPEPTVEPATPTPDTSVVPALFAPGIITTEEEHEWHITFTPDGETAYFSRSGGFFPQTRQATILVSTLEGGEWSEPEVAPFSGEFSDIDPFVSPDGLRLFFSSIRPVDGVARDDIDIWMVEQTESGWSEPVHLGDGVNSEADELYPSVASDGMLYFASDRSGGEGAWDIYRSAPADSGYGPAENLGAPLNTSAWEYNPAVSADGTLLLFASLNRPGGEGAGDIFVSEGTDGRWKPPASLGAPVNTPADEYHPGLSPDGSRLFFVRRSGNGDIYYLDNWR